MGKNEQSILWGFSLTTSVLIYNTLNYYLLSY